MRIEAVKLEGEDQVVLPQLQVADVAQLVNSEVFTWIDISISKTDTEQFKTLMIDDLDFHPKTVEDCLELTTHLQAKMDEEQEYKFISFLYFEGNPREQLVVRELNIYFSRTYVITVHSHDIEQFSKLFRRPPRHIVEYRERAILFLHHIIDMLTDSYTGTLRQIQSYTDELEFEVFDAKRPRLRANPFSRRKDTTTDMKFILRSRQSLVMMRRTLSSESSLLNQIIREYNYDGAPESSEEIAIYFSDIRDHVLNYLEIIESEDRSLNHVMEVHSLITGYQTNEKLYILTIMSTLMLPLTLITGFWGMNFDNLWWNHTPNGIYMVALLMLAVTVSLIAFFRNRNWI
ncbi:MAG: magnesium transporter CorA family protein [bacterium]